ncbi:cell division ATP-binding protein FtsE [uncultured Tyzzerella sp.]|uniref:cell division ATP-binding protein FtsE n=1 Tax=uncultured Tyzzerella sp. TaxID=2321398 RepID=UPI002942F484|nr:cell division ATP-binding protein FtsE [uncultured Tyzzerella sp.]
MISVDKVTKIYDNGSVAINNVSLNIRKGEFVFVIGSSGSGKSTFMKMLLKEVEPTEGKIVIDGININNIKRKEIPFLRRKIGVVFQDFRLLPSKTVFENIAFALQVTETSPKAIRRNVPAILAMVGLTHKAKAYPNELSGGEQQRVALARAIINKPPILLADEPTGNLDPETAWEIMELLKEINARGTTVVIATHAKDIVDEMKKRVITLQKGIILSDKEGGYNYED